MEVKEKAIEVDFILQAPLQKTQLPAAV